MTQLISLTAVMLAASPALRGTIDPSGVEVGGKKVLSTDPQESIGQLESALIPARGKSFLLRVEEGVTYEFLSRVLAMTGVVGVERVEIEHGESCLHVLETLTDLKSPVFTIVLEKKGYLLSVKNPVPASKEPTLPLADGAYPHEALRRSLKAAFPNSSRMEVILASEHDMSVGEMLRTWDVIVKEPRVKNVVLGKF